MQWSLLTGMERATGELGDATLSGRSLAGQLERTTIEQAVDHVTQFYFLTMSVLGRTAA